MLITTERLGCLVRWTRGRARLFLCYWQGIMSLTEQIESAIHSVIGRYGCALVQSTFLREKNGMVLRVLIEKEDTDPAGGSGVNLALCSSISRDLGTLLDVEDIIAQAYTLEVSSAGIERPLVQARDYERFAGRKISLKTKKALDGRRSFKGTLRGLTNGSVNLLLRDSEDVSIPFDLVQKANLVFDPKGFEANAGDK
jgi:ribosome maturation factor RimP